MDDSRMQSRTARASAQRIRVTEDDMLNEGEYDDVWPRRMPSSARRYQGIADVRSESGHKQADVQSSGSGRQYTGNTAARLSVPPRRSAVQGDRQRISSTEEVAPQRSSGLLRARPRVRFHWLVFVGIALFIMIIGWLTFSALGSWWQVTQDDWHYGRPRTFQMDAVVGHNDSPSNPTHFIAENLNRHIIIIEIPGGDPSKAKIYSGPVLIGPGQDLTAITLTFKDVNGDGKPDMLVNVQDTHFVYINENGAFRPARPGEGGQSQ